jgi:hypothetical protein
MHRIALLLILGCTTTACVSIHVSPPPVAVQTPEGEVRASNAADAKHVAALLVELAPKVRAILGETYSRPPQVFVLDNYRPIAGDGCNYNGRILLNAKMRPKQRLCLAHELVHWQMAGAWEKLPHTVQEGLCDRIATELNPEMRIDREMTLTFFLEHSSVGDPVEALELTARDWNALAGDGRRMGLYGVGYCIVARIGFAELHEMCKQAMSEGKRHVPARELLARAGLSATDLGAWEPAIEPPIAVWKPGDSSGETSAASSDRPASRP